MFKTVFLLVTGKRPVNKDIRNSAWQILSQIQTMYKRSDIPKDLRPTFPPKVNPNLTKEVIDFFLNRFISVQMGYIMETRPENA